MANVSLINTNAKIKLAPGQTEHLWWNNATPGDSVWSANAVPINTTNAKTGFLNQDSSGEITRLWRRLIVNIGVPGQAHFEHEIHYEVKNVGNTEATFNVFLSAIS
jgi:phage-related tail fiber protein